MNTERTVDAWVVAITVAIMALALLWFRPLLVMTDNATKVVESVVAVLTGTGLRESLLGLVELGLDGWPWFKGWILGSSYVEGKWVGFYTEGNRRLFVIEIVRQEWSSVFINGRAFDEDHNPCGQWHSLMATVDGSTGLLRAIFSGDFMTGKKATVDGSTGLLRGILSGNLITGKQAPGGAEIGGHYESLVTFQLDGHKAPSRMYGLIVDSVAAANAAHAWIRLRRVDNNLNDADAIAAAIELLRDDPGNGVGGAP